MVLSLYLVIVEGKNRIQSFLICQKSPAMITNEYAFVKLSNWKYVKDFNSMLAENILHFEGD